MATAEDIERLVAPVVSAAGLELVDVELIPSPRVLRVSVDAPAGVDLDGLGALAKTISHLLDEAEAVPGGHYDLEVSSPGLERRLRRPEHFAKAIGSRVRVRTRPGSDGDRRAEGVLVGADDKGISLAGDAGDERSLLYSDIERARTVFDWQAALAAAPSRPAGGRAGRAARRDSSSPSRDTEPASGRERAATS
jgi:ribosome maturation factor RimP